MVQQIPTRLATSINAVPSKVAYAFKAVADKKQEEEGGAAPAPSDAAAPAAPPA